MHNLAKEYMAWLKTQPCFLTGDIGVDVAHIHLLTRRGSEFKPRLGRTLDMTHKSHQGVMGFYAIPLKPFLHRHGAPHAYHTVGQRKWLEHWGVSEAELAGYVAQKLAEFLLSRSQSLVKAPPTEGVE